MRKPIGQTPTFLIIEYLAARQYRTLFLLWLLASAVFGVLYFLLSHWPDQGLTGMAELPLWSRFWSSLYFSIITATSTGYGDITPLGISRILASLQSVLAILIFGLFIAKLISHRTDKVLTEVHRLSFEHILTKTREGFFLIRKDWDRLLLHLRQHARQLSDQEWRDFAVACRQASTLIADIPKLTAGGEEGDYVLDLNRKQLLLETVERTLHRLTRLFESLEHHRIHWVSSDASTEVQRLIDTIERILPTWKAQSPHDHGLSFEEIELLAKGLREHLKRILPLPEPH